MSISAKVSGQSEYSYDAEYRGQIKDGAVRLVGAQQWRVAGQTSVIELACTMDLVRAAQPR
jgi:predicted glycosyl hydrolase (DUF1957 family)